MINLLKPCLRPYSWSHIRIFFFYKRKKKNTKQTNQETAPLKLGAFLCHSHYVGESLYHHASLLAGACLADLVDGFCPNKALSRVPFLLRKLGFSLIYIVQVTNRRYTILRITSCRPANNSARLRPTSRFFGSQAKKTPINFYVWCT